MSNVNVTKVDSLEEINKLGIGDKFQFRNIIGLIEVIDQPMFCNPCMFRHLDCHDVNCGGRTFKEIERIKE